MLNITTLPEHFSSKCAERFVTFIRDALLFWNLSLNAIALLSSSNKHSQDDHGVECSSKLPETELCWTRRYLKSHRWPTEQKTSKQEFNFYILVDLQETEAMRLSNLWVLFLFFLPSSLPPPTGSMGKWGNSCMVLSLSIRSNKTRNICYKLYLTVFSHNDLCASWGIFQMTPSWVLKKEEKPSKRTQTSLKSVFWYN